MTELLIKDAVPRTIGAASISGWSDSNTFLQWLKHFVNHAKPTSERQVILMLDGHASHKTLEAIHLARTHNMIHYDQLSSTHYTSLATSR